MKIYVIIVVILIGGIVGLWPKNQQIVKDVPKPGEIVVEEKGIKITTTNVSGVVRKWDAENGILTVDIAGNNQDFVIDFNVTKVLVGRSQNIYKDTKMYVLDQNVLPMHWQQAFCPDDGVSMLLDKSGVVIWIMDTDLRMCGFKEEIN